jgi:hypothetical protein
LSDGPDEVQARVAAVPDLVAKLVKNLADNNLEVLTPSLRTIGNLMAGDDVTAQIVINHGALPVLKKLLSHPKSTIRKETCWSLSNVLAGQGKQIRACLDAGVFAPILANARSDRAEIRREASWCIANVFSGASPSDMIEMMESADSIVVLCDLLKEPNSTLVGLCVSALHRVLKLGEVLSFYAESESNPYVSLIANHGLNNLLLIATSRGSNAAKAFLVLQSYFYWHYEQADWTLPVVNP